MPEYRAAIDPFLPLAYTAGIWSSEQQAQQWVDVVATLAKRRRNTSGSMPLVDLRLFAATLVLYAFGLGTVVGRRPRQLGVLVGKIVDFGDGSFALGDRLNIAAVMTDGGADLFELLPAYQNKRLPGNELIADVLRPLSKYELRDADAFDAEMARLELAMAFGYAERMGKERSGDWFWAPPGRFVLNRHLRESLLAAWRTDHLTRALLCEVCVMAALAQPPRFGEVQGYFNRAGVMF